MLAIHHASESKANPFTAFAATIQLFGIQQTVSDDSALRDKNHGPIAKKTAF
jgi:hypothetical protein